jgi:hypothetical protein
MELARDAAAQDGHVHATRIAFDHRALAEEAEIVHFRVLARVVRETHVRVEDLIGQEGPISRAEVRFRIRCARHSLREAALDPASGIGLVRSHRVDEHREQLDGENRRGAGDQRRDEPSPPSSLRPFFAHESFQRIPVVAPCPVRFLNIPFVRGNEEGRAPIGGPSSARIRLGAASVRASSGSSAERLPCTESAFSFSSR